MRHFPIFMDLSGARVVLSGGFDAATAKLRLLLKTEARIEVFAPRGDPQIATWETAGRLIWHRRALRLSDLAGARLLYAADEDALRDAEVAALGRQAGVLVNIVDNLHDSEFITPAMVDRDPVTVAIGTEGAAPVLARRIKEGLEAQLPSSLGALTRAAQAFRVAAEALPEGRARRDFWGEYFDDAGPRAHDAGGADALRPALKALLDRHLSPTHREGQITLAWTGWADPEMLIVKTRRALDRADVVVHDADLPLPVLELARREAEFLIRTPGAALAAQLAARAAEGLHVVYLSTQPLPDELEAQCRRLCPRTLALPGLPGPDQPSLKETA